MVVVRLDPTGHLEVLADARSPLRLARDVGNGGRLSPEAIQRTVDALRDFQAVAVGTGARQTIAVATSAIRESKNADQLLERILVQSGLAVRVIDGREEARYAFLGAIHGIPAMHGMVMDIGGGSMELSRFRDRELVESWSLPLGALRLSDRFLGSDPPAASEVEEARRHVRRQFRDHQVPPLRSDEVLVGTGGTIRNLAKVDRQTRTYPIPRLQGYLLTRQGVKDLAGLLIARPLNRRRAISGLNADRADSIVGGVLATETAMEVLDAGAITVTGQGLREGLAYEALGRGSASPEEVRTMSVDALVHRFRSWDAGRAGRRARIAVLLLASLEPDAGPNLVERVSQAATLLDVGRSIDYYRRYEHTANILTESDLAGFTHRKLALLAAVVRQAGDETMKLGMYRPLLGPEDRRPVVRQATVVALADEIERRVGAGKALPVTCDVGKREVVLQAPLFDGYRQGLLSARFRRAFGKRLVFAVQA